jgi:predicted nucleic acid-binding OB-fold protein
MPFTSFQDVADRTHVRAPKDTVVKRILSELAREDKYSLFTRKPMEAKGGPQDLD